MLKFWRIDCFRRLCWGENTLNSFQNCIGKEASQQSAEGSENKFYVVMGLNFIRRQSLCSVQLVDIHSGFFAAAGRKWIDYDFRPEQTKIKPFVA